MNGIDFNAIILGLAVGAVPVLYAITMHEVAHGWAARRYGDRTAEMMGRLSLNPIKHVDPLGTIAVPLLCWIFTGWLFGYAKPVPVAFNNLRKPKRDMVLVALAGPSANVLMAIGWALLIKLVLVLMPAASMVAKFLVQMAEIGILINVLLAVFNLIPIPPLDGGRVLRGLVSEGIGKYLDRIEPFGLIILVLLLVYGGLFTFIGPLRAMLTDLVRFLAGL